MADRVATLPRYTRTGGDMYIGVGAVVLIIVIVIILILIL
jgi:hypothetical protein